jgi:hypothetical protein
MTRGASGTVIQGLYYCFRIFLKALDAQFVSFCCALVAKWSLRIRLQNKVMLSDERLKWRLSLIDPWAVDVFVGPQDVVQVPGRKPFVPVSVRSSVLAVIIKEESGWPRAYFNSIASPASCFILSSTKVTVKSYGFLAVLV